MSRPATLLRVDEADGPPALAQARAWVKKIPATEKAYFIDRAQAFRDEPRSAAEKRLERLAGGTDPHDAVLAYQLILDLLENPDALLG